MKITPTQIAGSEQQKKAAVMAVNLSSKPPKLVLKSLDSNANTVLLFLFLFELIL